MHQLINHDDSSLLKMSTEELEEIIRNQNKAIIGLKSKFERKEQEKKRKISSLNEKKFKLAETRKAHIQNLCNLEFRVAQLPVLIPKNEDFRESELLNNLSNTQVLTYKQSFLNPLVNLMYTELLDASKAISKRISECKDDIMAWKFNPESTEGKMLITRLRKLLNDNAELGKFQHSNHQSNSETLSEIIKSCMQDHSLINSTLQEILYEISYDSEGLQALILAIRSELDKSLKILSEKTETQCEESHPM